MAVARAYADVGMRAVLAPMIADKTLFQAIPGLLEALPRNCATPCSDLSSPAVTRPLRPSRSIVAARGDMPEGIKLAIAPTIPHHCSERFLRDCVDIADRHELPIHMHIAESRLQAIAAHKLYGRSPVRYLGGFGVLRPGFIAAHGVWLDDDDLDLLAGTTAPSRTFPPATSGLAPVSHMSGRCSSAASMSDWPPTAPIRPTRSACCRRCGLRPSAHEYSIARARSG